MNAEPAATLSAIESFHVGVLVVPDVFFCAFTKSSPEAISKEESAKKPAE